MQLHGYCVGSGATAAVAAAAAADDDDDVAALTSLPLQSGWTPWV
jgi:hypothetical protein